MSYHRNPQYQELGGIMDVAAAAKAIVEDPCLPSVASLVLRLHAAEQPKRPPARPGQPPPPPAPPVKGIGLCYAVKPLKAVVYVRERPWVGIAVGAAIVGGIFMLGRASARRR